ncbi:MAG: ornithine carbamoyltransferase [Gemmataceae bacterium]|nr:ornithine carbamoyltransferase [Gemmataceae bacterium]
MTRHLLEITDLTAHEIHRLLDDADRIRLAPQNVGTPLAGRLLGLVFEKPSLRTRASFESAAVRLGGASLFFSGGEVNLGVRESYEDFARVFSQYVDAMVLRVFSHETVAAVARAATVPVINGLSDLAHPCQALADLLTIRQEFGSLAGKTVAFIGDGNNVARSLAFACALVGAKLILARPAGYGFAPGVPARQTTDARAAVRTADVIYSDVWTSMGQEAERVERLRVFAPYQVNSDLLAAAPPHALVMHCLPAHRGEEITSDVLDGPRCVAVRQAGNRMYAQAALLQWLLVK